MIEMLEYFTAAGAAAFLALAAVQLAVVCRFSAVWARDLEALQDLGRRR